MFIQVVRATVRMKKCVEVWSEKRKIHDRLVDKMKQQKIEEMMLGGGKYITNGNVGSQVIRY